MEGKVKKVLDKQAILMKLDELRYPKEQFWVCSGAALVLFGVKKYTCDIDLGVTSELFENLLQQGFSFHYSQQDGTRIMNLGQKIEALENWGLTSDKVLLHGVQVEALASIRKQKEELAREKDLQDISLIDQFLRKKNEVESK